MLLGASPVFVCLNSLCPALSQGSAGIGLLQWDLMVDNCSLLRVQSKPLFPELSCAISAELSVAPQHFHLCFTSVYKLCRKTHQVKSTMGKFKRRLCGI